MTNEAVRRGLILGERLKDAIGGKIPVEEVGLLEFDGGSISAPHSVASHDELTSIASQKRVISSRDQLGPESSGVLFADRGFAIRQRSGEYDKGSCEAAYKFREQMEAFRQWITGKACQNEAYIICIPGSNGLWQYLCPGPCHGRYQLRGGGKRHRKEII